jgi:nickel-dependent lactate racemase
MQRFEVPQLAWFGRGSLTLEFPDDWRVEYCPMLGYNAPPITAEDIRAALLNPIGSRTIQKLAEGRKEAAIIFDDMTRPTRVYEIAPLILEELRRGGITSDHVRFICALGAHGACYRYDFAKKLGESIVEEYPVYNHNPFHNLTEVGKTSRGTPVIVNSEVMECDVKIGIGCTVPHPFAGFGGGGKIMLPGVAGIESINYNHGVVAGNDRRKPNPNPTAVWGSVANNVCKSDMDEFARVSRLDFKVDALVNGLGETVALYAGDVVDEHRESIKLGRRLYNTQLTGQVDVLVANTYAKANEASLALGLWGGHVRSGGAIVIIAEAPEGQVTHYVYGKFGKERGGTLYAFSRVRKTVKIIVYSKYRLVDPFLPIADNRDLVWVKTWKEALEEVGLAQPSLRAAVLPNAEIQCPPEVLARP